MAGSLGLNVNDAKNQNISPLDKTSEEVRKAVSKHLQGQAVEALQQQTPKDVIAMINKLLPSEQQAAPAAGGVAIGKPPQTQTPEALPAISPQEQVQQVLGQLANFQSQQAQPQTSPEAQALTGNIQQPQATPVGNERGFVGGIPGNILTALGLQQRPTTRFNIAQAKLAEQELAGQKPLQKGAREKIALESVNAIKKELAKGGSADALKPENAQKFALLLEGRDSTLKINDLLGSNVTGALFKAGVPGFLKSQKGRELQSNVEQSIQARTRIETGAAMAPSELKATSKRFMPRAGDSLETARKRLRKLFTFFDSAINIADPTGVHSQRATGQQAVKVPEGAIAEAKRRGLR